MNTSRIQPQIDALKSDLVEKLTGLIRDATSEAVTQALAQRNVLVRVKPTKDGRFTAAIPGGQVVTRSRRRDVVRAARSKGYIAA